MRVESVFIATIFSAFAATAGELSYSSYVQDGLIAQVDGEYNAVDNAGNPVHSTDTTKWYDLKAGRDFAWSGSSVGYSVGEKWYAFTSVKGGHFNRTIPDVISLINEGGGFTVEESGAYESLDILGVGVRLGTCGIYFQNSCVTHTTSTGQRGNWISMPANTFMSASIVYGPTAEVAEIRPFLNGLHNEGNASVTYNSTYSPASGTLVVGNFSSTHSAIGRIFSARVYARRLTDSEVEWNNLVDTVRFNSFVWQGTDSSDWTAAANWVPPSYKSGAPTGDDVNVRIAAGGNRPEITADAKLRVLAIDSGATLQVAAGVKLGVRTLLVDGEPLARGVYTADGSVGIQADFLAGSGELWVAGGLGRSIPEVYPTPETDGTYVFGTNRTFVLEKKGSVYCKSSYYDFGTMIFPANAEVHFVTNLIADGFLTSGTKINVDLLKSLALANQNVYPEGEKIVIPSGANFYYVPGTFANTTGVWYYTYRSDNLQRDLELNGTWNISEASPAGIIDGKLSGSGTVKTANFTRQVSFNGDLDYNGGITFQGGACGTYLHINSSKVTGKISKVLMESYDTSSKWRFNSQYFQTYIRYSPKIGHSEYPLRIANWETKDGNYAYDSATGKFWRYGNSLFFYDDNRVIIDKLTGSGAIHIVADQTANLTTRVKIGNAYLDLGEVSSTARLYLSTNVYLTVGKVTAGATFNYACESNAVTTATLDITNGCSTAAIVKASDIAMLPARMTGFTGSVNLIRTEALNYPVTIDFDSEVYNYGGTDGSGTLAAAPAAGHIEVTLTGTPVRGDYALARFTEGGEKLAAWTVTAPNFYNGFTVDVVKDSTGIWLAVHKTGMLHFLK